MGRFGVECGVVTETKPKNKQSKYLSSQHGKCRATEDHAESSVGGVTAQEPSVRGTLNLAWGQW